MPSCSECGGTTIEYDSAAGSGFCTICGTVLEESTIVSEITFGETSSGAAIVQGSFVGQGATTARLNNPFSRHNNSLGSSGATSESREITIANATRKIQSIANLMRLPNTVVLSATRLYTLAVEHKFTKGRKSMNVVAVCLYIACRQKEAGTRCWMLIDFSDLLQVNVFELGHCYLNLIQALHLRLPLVDPSHYISRFASLLEFGDDTNRVAQDAVRVVARFDRDWMTRGRRPAGICGAALLLAARMNGFNRSTEEVVQIVKIADTTLKKRLEEFKNTPSGKLSVADFRNVWLDEECDPPAFTKNREVERTEGEDEDEDEDGGTEGEGDAKKKGKRKKKKKDKNKEKVKKSKKGKGKRKRQDSDVSGNEDKPSSEDQPGFDPDLFKQGILVGVIDLNPDHEFVPPTGPSTPPATDDHSPEEVCTTEQPVGPISSSTVDEEQSNIDPQLQQHRTNTGKAASTTNHTDDEAPTTRLSENSEKRTEDPTFPEGEIEASLDATLALDITSVLASTQGVQLSEVLDAKEHQRLADMKMRREQALEGLNHPISATTQQEASAEYLADDVPPVSEEREFAHVQDAEADLLLDLDEAELDWFILSEEEVKVRERVWVEMNKDYLEALALKGDQTSDPKRTRKRQKTSKPRDSSTASGDTAAESVQKMMKKNPKYSKRINYDVLKGLLDSNAIGDAGRLGTPFPGLPRLEDKDDDDMYHMTPERSTPANNPELDSEKDPEIVVIQEGEGVVAEIPFISANKENDHKSGGETTEAENEEEEEEEEEMNVDGKESWEDQWEQEI